MARSFNGTTDLINAGNSSILNPNGASVAMTVSAWVYGTSFPNAYNSVISRDNGTTVAYQLLVKSTGKLAIYYTENSGTSLSYDGNGTNTLSANTWYHLLFTIPALSPGQMTGYVNGSSDGVAPTTGGGIEAVTANTTIGINNTVGGTARWAGRLADIGVWSIVLSIFEISALAKGARPYTIRPQSLVGYWPLDGLQSPEPDLSGNANNGTLTGTALAFGAPIMQFTPRWPQMQKAVIAAAAAKARHNLNMPLPW